MKSLGSGIECLHEELLRYKEGIYVCASPQCLWRAKVIDLARWDNDAKAVSRYLSTGDSRRHLHGL